MQDTSLSNQTQANYLGYFDITNNRIPELTSTVNSNITAITQLSTNLSGAQTNTITLATRVNAIGATNDVPGKLKIDDSSSRDPNFVFHIGGNRVMAGRLDIPTTVTESLDNRALNGSYNTFRAGEERPQLTQYQMHVVPSKAWVKTLEVQTSLTAPQLTDLQSRVERAR